MRLVHDTGGPCGAYIKNKILVLIEFKSAVNIHEMDRRIRKRNSVLEIIVGRPQNHLEVNVKHAEDGNESDLSSAYINMYPNQERQAKDSELHYHDVLIDAVEQSDKFARLIGGWLKRDELALHNARMRFSWGWEKQRSYNADRIVGAADMFDLIPNDAFPKDVSLACDLEEAVQKSHRRFKSLPPSSKRDAVLNTLGNIRKPSLKKKIRYRTVKMKNRCYW